MRDPDPELLAWRARGGGVAKAGGYYLNRSLPIPAYLAELTQNGLVALTEADPAGLRRATITPTGQAQYSALREPFRQRDVSARTVSSI